MTSETGRGINKIKNGCNSPLVIRGDIGGVLSCGSLGDTDSIILLFPEHKR